MFEILKKLFRTFKPEPDPNDPSVSPESLDIKGRIYRIVPSYQKGFYYVESNLVYSWYRHKDYSRPFPYDLFTLEEAEEKIRRLKILDAHEDAKEKELQEWRKENPIRYY